MPTLTSRRVFVLIASASLIPAGGAHCLQLNRGKAAVGDSTICLPDSPKTRSAVVKFLTSSSFADDRAQMGITVADTANLRVLVDSTDAAVCRWLRREVTIPTDRPRDAAYYKAGGFFFVSNVPRCSLCMAWGGLFVLDSTFAPRGAFGI